MIELEPDVVFRVKPAGDRWKLEYLRRHVLPENQTEWRVVAVKPVYDRAVWVLWERVTSAQADQPDGD
jgi:hypothetical protein